MKKKERNKLSLNPIAATPWTDEIINNPQRVLDTLRQPVTPTDHLGDPSTDFFLHRKAKANWEDLACTPLQWQPQYQSTIYPETCGMGCQLIAKDWIRGDSVCTKCGLVHDKVDLITKHDTADFKGLKDTGQYKYNDPFSPDKGLVDKLIQKYGKHHNKWGKHRYKWVKDYYLPRGDKKIHPRGFEWFNKTDIYISSHNWQRVSKKMKSRLDQYNYHTAYKDKNDKFGHRGDKELSILKQKTEDLRIEFLGLGFTPKQQPLKWQSCQDIIKNVKLSRLFPGKSQELVIRGIVYLHFPEVRPGLA